MGPRVRVYAESETNCWAIVDAANNTIPPNICTRSSTPPTIATERPPGDLVTLNKY